MKAPFKKGILIFFLLSLILQCVIVFLSDGAQVDDMGGYLRMAQRIVETGVWYPNSDFLYSDYIHAPGYVNCLAVFLLIFKTIKSALYFNVLLNAILAFEIFYIAKKHFTEATAYLSLLLFALYPTTYGIVCFAASDLPSMVLFFGAIILFAKGGIRNAIIAGMLIAVANWMRPFLPVSLIVICCITFFILQKTDRVKSLSAFLCSTALIVILIGLASFNRFGHFVFQSSTSGVNIIMGANDDADGSYEPIVFGEGKIGHTPKEDSLTVFQKDVFWREQSIEWIKENPMKWTLLFPAKFFFLYAQDSHAMSPLSGDMAKPVQGREYNYEMISIFPHWNAFQWLMFYNQLFYCVSLLLACLGIYYVLKSKNTMGRILLLYWVVTTAMVLLTVGTNRYHYPFMPVVLIFAAFAITTIQKNKSLKYSR